MARSPKKKQKKTRRPPAPLEERAARWPATHAWVDRDWRTVRPATVVIVRESPGGELAAGVFLVDLDCRGVVDASIQSADLDVHRRYDASPGMEAVSPAEGATLVLRGQAWAERWGLGTHRSWQTCQAFVTSLEPVDDLEVPLGRDGKPFFLASASDRNPGRILDTLREHAGDDGFSWEVGPDLPPEVGTRLITSDPSYQAQTQDLVDQVVQRLKDTGEVDVDLLTEGLKKMVREHQALPSEGAELLFDRED